ncbi:hypothetical protein Syun_001617 [Stephania yunnanensis]|uniref:Uncharacterized protein n=1 Tax=Stephania yunnanensis TaxID=152371 RepID=A0AAP0Q6G4_9MAGN
MLHNSFSAFMFGVWHSLELIDFPSFASLETHAEIVEALRETVVDHLVIVSSYLLKRCFVEDFADLTKGHKNRVAMHNLDNYNSCDSTDNRTWNGNNRHKFRKTRLVAQKNTR